MTKHAISVFIMDVTDSSSLSPNDVKDYLQTTVRRITQMAELSHMNIAVQQRLGDEVLLVGQGYTTAYVIAFWLMLTWKYEGHKPYFGVGCGDVAAEFPTSSELHEWNSPIVKVARVASDQLREQRPHNREWLKFGEFKRSQRDSFLFSMINEYVEIQDRFLKMHTSVERLVSFLRLVENRQDDIADRLGKSPSTISRQLKKSNIDLIVKIKQRISDMLSILEVQSDIYRKNDMEVDLNRLFKNDEVRAISHNDPSVTHRTDASLIQFYRHITPNILSELRNSD